MQARVIGVHPFGAFCKLAPGITGLLLVPYFANQKAPKNVPEDYPAVGELIEARIRIISREDQKIGLTQRSHP